MIRTLTRIVASWRAEPMGAQAEVPFRQWRDLMATGKVAEACNAFPEAPPCASVKVMLLVVGAGVLAMFGGGLGLELWSNRRTPRPGPR